MLSLWLCLVFLSTSVSEAVVWAPGGDRLLVDTVSCSGCFPAFCRLPFVYRQTATSFLIPVFPKGVGLVSALVGTRDARCDFVSFAPMITPIIVDGGDIPPTLCRVTPLNQHIARDIHLIPKVGLDTPLRPYLQLRPWFFLTPREQNIITCSLNLVIHTHCFSVSCFHGRWVDR